MLPFSDKELFTPVSISIDKVRPALLRDGGNVEIIKIENGEVFLRFQGACSGCASKNITLKNGIEATLRRDIHPDIKVCEI